MTEPKKNDDAKPPKDKPELEPINTGGDYPDFPNTYSPTAVSSASGGGLFDEIIPPPEDVPHRNLVLCFDGTGDQFDADVTIYCLPVVYHQLPDDITSRIPISSRSFQC
jgi:hypothetical protein